jgi:hypothetical protein
MTTKDSELTTEERMKALKELSMGESSDQGMNKPLVLFTLLQFMRDDITVIQKKAYASILDQCIAGWRDLVPEILGPIVERNGKEVREWYKRILERDEYTCTECGSKEHVKVYRLFDWNEHPDIRLSMSNAKSACDKCFEIAHE